MEEIEVANREAVESGHRVLTLLAQLRPQDQASSRSLMAETLDSVLKFRRLVSLMGDRFAVARARRMTSFSFPNPPQKLFSETDPKSKSSAQITLKMIVDDDDDGSGIDTSLSIKHPSAEISQQNPLQSGSSRSVVSSLTGLSGNPVQGTGFSNRSDECHCSKRRKLRVRRSIKVPAISTRVADIPSDEFSWRKYGQKPIKGSPYPSMKGCPARKHVERCLEEPTMLVITYEGDHNHSRPEH